MTKRNPCTYLIETFDSSGQYLVKQERRGYAQAFYLWKRINQDQILLEKTRPRNTRGLYFNQSDLDSYIRDYFNYGMDWDDTSKEELQEQRYWDERDIDV